MSLHDKVIAWFVCFACLTVILFVLGDYFQSTRALQIALESRATAFAGQAAADVNRRYERSQGNLLRISYRVASAAAADSTSLPADFSSVRIYSDDSLIWQAERPVAEAGSDACATGVIPFQASFTDASSRTIRAEGVMSAAVFFGGVQGVATRLGSNGVTAVVETGTGSLIFDNGCVLGSRATPVDLWHDLIPEVRAALPEGARNRIVTFSPGEHDERFLAAITRVEEPAWSVIVALDYGRWAAPFVAARTEYLALMIGVMLLALLFMLHIIRHDMLRLAAIARAADSIGRGQFDVWLPPPTGDELGRLSLALGRMVDRLSQTMHKMELGAAMAAVGELATYLSHEIRNPLSSIRLNLQMLKRDMRGGSMPEDGEHLVGLSLTELQRLDDVVRTVLDVGRRGPEIRGGACDAHEVVAGTLQVMETKLALHGIEVQTRLEAINANVAIASSQLKSVLINLLLNAVDALGNVPFKRILIATDLLQTSDGDLYVEMRVMDNGPGVPAHLRQRIFEPFFTTKAAGNGIGLATSLRVVAQGGGQMLCLPRSEEMGGAEFVLELPLVRHRSQSLDAASLAAAG